MTTGSIITDEHGSTVGDDDFDAAAAFLSNLTGEEPKPSTQTDDAAPATQETAQTEAPEQTNIADDDTHTDPDPDDAEVEIKVGEETKKATLKDLKRLYGQEASLTQKAQKLAEQTRTAVEQDARASAALKAMLERAQARYAPFANVDMLVMSQQMDTETFQQLRTMEAEAKADVDFLRQELQGHMQAQQQAARAAYTEAANACVKALTNSDSPAYIEGWGKPMYDELASFSEQQGFKGFRAIVDPAAIKLVHMAMQFAKGADAAQAAARKIEKVAQQPRRVLKPGASKAPNDNDPKRGAMAQLRRSGDIDDAAAAFAALG